MVVSKRIFLRWVLPAVLCIAVVLFFGNFCVLRPLDFQHPYKEYLSGVIVLAMVFVNMLLIFPTCYKNGYLGRYLLLSALSIVAAFLAEMLMIIGDVFPQMASQFSHRAAMAYLAVDGLYVLLRDFSFALTVSMAQVALYYRQRFADSETLIFQKFKKIEVEDLNSHNVVLVGITDIAYVMQKKNYTFLLLSNGKELRRHGSLKSISRLLCPQYAAQVSRKCLVVYASVKAYSPTRVFVKTSREDIVLPLSEKYCDEALELFGQHVSKNSADTRRRTWPDDSSVAREKNGPYRTTILNFIKKKPGCSAGEIKKNRRFSQSTVNRILAQLKKEGLVEYQGSKKKGGYYVVERGEEEMIDNS
jgi:hypothetical protein